MTDCQTTETTQLLRAWAHGEQTALNDLTPLVYHELRRIAGHYMQNEGLGHTMQATALVHEAYLRLVDVSNVNWQSRGQFFTITARIMRNILLDSARARRSAKRGGQQARVDLHEIPDVGGASNTLIELDEALNSLAAVEPRRAKVIELRFFGGLSVAETAAALNISAETVMRDARFAQAWLNRELSRTTDRQQAHSPLPACA